LSQEQLYIYIYIYIYPVNISTNTHTTEYAGFILFIKYNKRIYNKNYCDNSNYLLPQ